MHITNRAKHLYSNKYFISNSVDFRFNQMYLKIEGIWVECDEATRAINMNNMVDSDGTEIFASLSEDGKGGDIGEIPYYAGLNSSQKIHRGYIYFNKHGVILIDEKIKQRIDVTSTCKVTGIQE